MRFEFLSIKRHGKCVDIGAMSDLSLYPMSNQRKTFKIPFQTAQQNHQHRICCNNPEKGLLYFYHQNRTVSGISKGTVAQTWKTQMCIIRPQLIWNGLDFMQLLSAFLSDHHRSDWLSPEKTDYMCLRRCFRYNVFGIKLSNTKRREPPKKSFAKLKCKSI